MLQHKTILLISPQSWGKMYLSKHHYAIELANRGNTVYFLNPPEVERTFSRQTINIKDSGIENLFIIDHKLAFPFNIKFHAIGIFHWLMRFHIKKIIKAIGKRVDIVWSFDLGNLYPFRLFHSSALRIFHPVDEPLNKTAIDSGAGAQIIFSVTHEILEKYKVYDTPGHFINHGVAEHFLNSLPVNKSTGIPVKIGFSGNLIRNDIDRDILVQIIRENPAVHFHFWGSYKMHQSNISGSDDEATETFIHVLQQCKNVTLYGPVTSMQLAKEIQRMDGFLICYDVNRDQSKGTNYHKIMEYLSTGKVIISNNITTYNSQRVLVQMVESRHNNYQLPDLFKKVIGNLDEFNSYEKHLTRIRFAKDNLYANQLNRIEEILQKNITVADTRQP